MVSISFNNVYSGRVFRVEKQLLRPWLGVFQMVKRLGTTLPVNFKDVPRIDCGIEVDELGCSLHPLARSDSVLAGLPKRLKIQDGVGPSGFRFCRLFLSC